MTFTYDELQAAWLASGNEWAFEIGGFSARREIENGVNCFVVRTDEGSVKVAP